MLLTLLFACPAAPDQKDSVAPVDVDGDGADSSVDCDDDNAAVLPGATETCNSVDDDCDGSVDEEPSDGTTFYEDADGDGHGGDNTVNLCVQPFGYATTTGDCDDADENIAPDAAETCNGIDDDCDGLTDDDDDEVSDQVQTWPDTDGDGWGSGAEVTLSCTAAEGYALIGGDCDEASTAVHPTADESCNGVDDDCDGLTDADDSGVTDGETYYRDRDGDGVGGDARTRCADDDLTGYSSFPGDCDDTDINIWHDCTEPTFETTYDVVVVGTGPAGMAAAISAREMGANVLLVERSDVAGTGTIAGQGLMAAGTGRQADEGVEDSPELLISEWESFTGEPGDQESVRNFAEASAGVIDWLGSYGVHVGQLTDRPDMGSVPRTHEVEAGAESDPYTLVAAYDGELLLSTAVTAPVMWEDAVVGVHLEDQGTGTAWTVGAHAVVLATGGFQRDEDLLYSLVPGLSTTEFLFECLPSVDGGGVHFLDLVGSEYVNRDVLGFYLHSIQDPYGDLGEALTWNSAGTGVIVGEDGNRFYNEEDIYSFEMYRAAPEGALWAVITEDMAENAVLDRPFYTSASGNPEEYALLDFYGVTDDIVSGTSILELGEAMGVDAMTLAETVRVWNATVDAGDVDAFGRDTTDVATLTGDVYYAVRLLPGLAKSFGGARTDPETHVIDEDGVWIAGLFAAGEVAEMLPGGGSGSGWGGAVAGCYYGGRVAGQSAASYAETF